MTEDALVEKTVSMLRQAKKVIELMHAEKEESFQEEPSLGDLVMVAQILAQTSVSERLEASTRSLSDGVKSFTPPSPASLGQAALAEPTSPPGPPFELPPPPDVVAVWMGDHWDVSLGENFMWKTCSTLDELSKALLDSATFAAEYRLKERPSA